jgi:transposase
MPAPRLTMRKTREILRLRLELGRSTRQTARSCGVAASTVLDVERRARAAGLPVPLPAELDEEELERRLYRYDERPRSGRALPDFEGIYRELKRAGVTLELLWQEYRARHPNDGYGYSRYCDLYRTWRGGLDVTMRIEHRAGEKVFVDWAGKKPTIINPETGEETEVSVFVAALGASDYTYAEAFADEKIGSWLRAHVHALEFFGGAAAAVVPDNLKTGVKKACYYEPDLNPAYRELAEHYGTVVLPTRVASPRDKAKVENAVQQVERWVLAPLRNQRFFSVVELNLAIRERLDWLNDRPFSRLSGTRRSHFLDVDRPALRPLPERRFEIAEWKVGAGVGIDYHVEFDHHFYSVPYTLVGKRVDVRATDTIVECFDRGRRVASHRRSRMRGRFTTEDSHRPKSHQRHGEWTPSRIIRWAETIGPETGAVAKHILTTKPHPEQGYRSCLGLIRLSERYSKERLERACRRARQIRSQSYKSVLSILKTGLDAQELLADPIELRLPLDPEGVRGADYYQ